MDLFKFLIVCFIYKINASFTARKEYKILKGQKATLNITATAHAGSVEECAIRCAKRHNCSHANFGNSNCDILKYDMPGIEIMFENEANTEFICKSIK